MYTVKTAGLVVLAHDAKALADRSDVSESDRVSLLAAHETLISASSLILRHEEAQVPIAISDHVNFVTECLRKYGT